MEVDGRLADSTGVVEWCQQCTDAGNNVTAVKFCSVCQDWLCSACTDFHRRFKASKHHTLFDKNALPVSFQDIEQENKTKYCKTHPNELLRYFCPTHKTLHCGDCAASSSCKMDKISNVCKDIINDEGFKELQSNIKLLMRETSALESSVNEMKTSVQEKGARDVAEVERFEQLIIAKLKSHSRSLKDDINIATSESQFQLEGVIGRCNEIRSVGEQLSKELDETIENNSEVFISYVEAKPVLQTTFDDLAAAKEQSKQKHNIFKKSVELEKTLEKVKSFGSYDVEEAGPPTQSTDTNTIAFDVQLKDTSTVSSNEVSSSTAQTSKQPKPSTTPGRESVSVVSSSTAQTSGPTTPPTTPELNLTQQSLKYTDFTNVKLSRVADINVKSATDRRRCDITDMAVIPGDLLLLANFRNQSVKLADLASGQLLDQLQLSGQPHRLCPLPGDRAAVSMKGQSVIQTISVTMKKLSLQDVINIEGACCGINNVNDYFVVGFDNPAKVVLIDKKGKIYKSITAKSKHLPLFKHPKYICVTTENTSKVIYISDQGTKTITRLSEELQVIQTFTDPLLKDPYGLVSLGGGQLLVVDNVGSSTSTLKVLDVTTGQVTVLLGWEENMRFTFCVAVSHALRTVYVTDYTKRCDVIRQYEYKFKY